MARHYFVGGPRDADYQDTVEQVPEEAVFNQNNELDGRYVMTDRIIEKEGVAGIVWIWESRARQ